MLSSVATCLSRNLLLSPANATLRTTGKLLDLVQQDLSALIADGEVFAALGEVDASDIVERRLLSWPVLVD